MEENKAHIIAVSMGYGHQRTAYPLRKLAPNGRVINANNYLGIPEEDKRVWVSTRSFYEFISRFKRIPFIGDLVFLLYDKIQSIPSYYPKRDLSKPVFFLIRLFKLIHKGWGRNLITKLKVNPIPIITTFFIPAFMAEYFKYPKDIYCVICDADIARVWASLEPKASRIKYFTPNSWTTERLKLYGIKEENIYLTGFPLPIENIGTEEEMEILKHDLRIRLVNLDPERAYYKRYKHLVDKYLTTLPKISTRPLTILFSIGGAGAQKEIVMQYVRSLEKEIKEEKIKLILSAGIREAVRNYFWEEIDKVGLKPFIDKSIEIIYEKDMFTYFSKFNERLRETDILWTKPSELSFYVGLGLPIIMAPTVGSQEIFNRRWLERIGAGISQENPQYANQWIFDFLKSGRFASAAMHGFIEAEKLGTYKIERIISGGNE